MTVNTSVVAKFARKLPRNSNSNFIEGWSRVARFPKPKYGRFFHYSRHACPKVCQLSLSTTSPPTSVFTVGMHNALLVST